MSEKPYSNADATARPLARPKITQPTDSHRAHSSHLSPSPVPSAPQTADPHPNPLQLRGRGDRIDYLFRSLSSGSDASSGPCHIRPAKTLRSRLETGVQRVNEEVGRRGGWVPLPRAVRERPLALAKKDPGPRRKRCLSGLSTAGGPNRFAPATERTSPYSAADPCRYGSSVSPIRNLSTPRAASRPSAMAHTISD